MDETKKIVEERSMKTFYDNIYEWVADRIRNSDWYMSIDAEDMDWYIKKELEKGE